MSFKKVVVLVTLSFLVDMTRSECPLGLCSLDYNATHMSENCNIEADTGCSTDAHCNGDGVCFRDRYQDVIYCNCSARRYGSACQYSINEDWTACAVDADCARGQCVSDAGGGSSCKCPLGFRGQRCEFETRVVLSKDCGFCENGGTQFIQGSKYGCLCPCGFSGSFCQHIDRNAAWHHNCREHICNGHGRCQVLDRNTAQCVCANGYYGKFCQYNTDASSDFNSLSDLPSYSMCTMADDDLNFRTCLNGGRIIFDKTTNNQQCKCLCSYHGQYCQYTTDPLRNDYKDACEHSNLKCHNGGTCNYDNVTCSVRCTCQSGFTGDTCETACEQSTGCAEFHCNEESTCFQDNCGNPYCVYNPSAQSNSRYIVIASVSFLTFVIGAIIVVLCMRRFSRKSMPCMQTERYESAPNEREMQNV